MNFNENINKQQNLPIEKVDEDDVDAIIRKNNYKLTADKIKEKLSKILNDPSQSAKRWIWELMQNAKDVKNKFGKVSVEIELFNDQLVFRHNGDPFKMANVTGLIQQVSSKDSNNTDEEVTGKFGTGFIATHLLSDVITVNGIVYHKNTHKEFEVVLDRGGRTSEELLPKIEDALEKVRKIDTDSSFRTIENYENDREEEHYHTSFSYILTNDEKKDAAKDGIADVENTLPLTLVNVPKIKQVKIINQIQNTINTYKSEDIYDDGQIRKIQIKVSNGKSRYFITYYTAELSLSVEVNDFENLKLIEHFGKTPNLYRDFPLIGSDKFYFPFVFNGNKLHPTEERSGIPIHSESAADHLDNRRLVESAFEAAKVFTNYLLQIGAQNLYVCAMSRLPDEKWQSASKLWYESLQKDYRSFLNKKALIETDFLENGKQNIELDFAYLPFYCDNENDRLKFYNIVAPFIGRDKIPKKELLINWIKASGPKDELKSWGRNIRYSIVELLEELQGLKNLDALSGKIQGEIKAIDWLNSLYAFLIEYKETDYLKEFAIIPNQNNCFQKLTPDTLHLEDKEFNIPDEFLNVLNDLGDDWKNKLIHREVKMPGQNIEKKDLLLASNRINEIIKKDDFRKRPNYFKIVIDILRNITSLENTENFRIEIFQRGKQLFRFEENVRKVSNTANFNFRNALNIYIEDFNSEIESLVNIYGLSKKLNIDKPAAVLWLDNYLNRLLSKQDYSHHIQFGNIVPNRYEEFCAYDDLKNFGTKESPLDDDLILILNKLDTSQDWNKKLVLDGINIDCQPKIFEELAVSVDSAIIEIEKQEAIEIGYINSFKESIFKLIEWCNQNESRSNYLKHFKQRKNDLWVKFSMTNEILTLIKDEEAIGTLRLIKESKVSKEQLADLLEFYPNGLPQNLMDYAKEDSRKKKEFSNLLKIGSKVEQLFVETLKDFNFLSNREEIVHAGGGSYDIRVSNPETGKSFYIELKSCKFQNTDPISIAISQAKRAVSELKNENFAIVVIERANENVMDVEYVRKNCKYFKNPGEYLFHIVDGYNTIEETANKNEKVDLRMDNAEFKGSLNYKWVLDKIGDSGFTELIKDINKVLL
ncbi:sacsin N-terminal ATP-binding-like domain-containing protein [Chryseobacterium sp. MIQD13]|uniref:sacsin N-terminal ATP-binding-like domain-containing protein n=1 Tax=Chryseobacterium sp. MIQD13 TaxID=3422310 RepID=UPI003D2D67AE